MREPIGRVGQRRQVVIPREIFDSLRMREGACPASTTFPGRRVDSSVLLPSAARCLMKNVTRPIERDGGQIEGAIERDNETGTD